MHNHGNLNTDDIKKLLLFNYILYIIIGQIKFIEVFRNTD